MNGLRKNIISEAREFVSDLSLLIKRQEKYERILRNLKKRHSTCDRQIVDLMHDIEFSDECSVEDKVYFYEELKRVQGIRRTTKDRIDFYAHVMVFYKRGSGEEQYVILKEKIEATIKAKENRKYRRRVKESEAV